MLSDRQLIDADKAYLRRQYPATSTELAAASLVSLRELSATFFDADPSEVTLTSGSFEGGSGSGTLTSKRDIRRIALEELIAERTGIARGGRRVIFSDFSRSAVST